MMVRFRGFLFSFCGAAMLCLLLFSTGVYWFGGVGQFMTFVNGKSVYFPMHQIDLGNCEPGIESVAVFKMTNLASREISVVGERSSCNCAFSEKIPIVIPSGKTVDIRITVRLPKYESSYDQTIIFMVAEPRKLGMHPVRITATIPNPLTRPIEESEISDDELTEDQPTHE